MVTKFVFQYNLYLVVTIRKSLETFSKYGYQSQAIDGVVILSLNTLVYSIRHAPDSSTIDDPLGQFSWMKLELEKASIANTPV